LNGLSLIDVAPSIVIEGTQFSAGGFVRVYPAWPQSILHIGYEDPDAGLGQNHGRHQAFTIDALASIALDVDRMTAT